VTLSAVGLALSAYLQYHHVTTYLDPGADSFCSVGAKVDCDTVALSGASVLLGVPVSLWGVIGFATMLWASLRRPALLLPLAAFAALTSIAYAIVSIAIVGSICLFCEATHVVALALFGFAWRSRDPESTRRALRSPRGLALPLGLPTLAIVVLHVFLPRYWALASWERGLSLPHGVDDDGRPWIGARTPKVVVHEYVDYFCAHCRIAAGRMRMRVAANPEAIRIVRHQMPRMHCRPGNPPRGHRCEAARVAICAGQQGKFWEADDWLIAHMPDAKRAQPARAAREIGLDAARLQKCLVDPEIWNRAHRDVAEAQRRGILRTPAYVVDGRRMDHEQANEAIDEKL